MKRIRAFIIGVCATLLFTPNVAYCEDFLEIDPAGYGWAETIPAKYQDDVLFGGNKIGHEDGSKENATVENVWSFVVTKNNDIYFIDSEQLYSGTGGYSTGSRDTDFYFTHENNYPYKDISLNQRIRKYSSLTKTVSTIANVNDMTLNYTDSKSATTIYQNSSTISKKQFLTDFTAYKLVYNPDENKIYLSGKFKKNFGKPCYRGCLYVINTLNDEMKVAVANSSYNFLFGADEFATVKAGTIIYSRRNANSFETYRVKEKGTAVKFTTATGTCNGLDSLEAVMTQNYLTVMKRNDSSITMSRYDLRKRTWSIIEVYNGSYDSIVAFGDKFFASSSREIDIIDTDGIIKPFIKSQEVNLNDAFDGGKMELINVTTTEDVIYYDSSNLCMRIIKKINSKSN